MQRAVTVWKQRERFCVDLNKKAKLNFETITNQKLIQKVAPKLQITGVKPNLQGTDEPTDGCSTPSNGEDESNEKDFPSQALKSINLV